MAQIHAFHQLSSKSIVIGRFWMINCNSYYLFLEFYLPNRYRAVRVPPSDDSSTKALDPKWWVNGGCSYARPLSVLSHTFLVYETKYWDNVFFPILQKMFYSKFLINNKGLHLRSRNCKRIDCAPNKAISFCSINKTGNAWCVKRIADKMLRLLASWLASVLGEYTTKRIDTTLDKEPIWQ